MSIKPEVIDAMLASGCSAEQIAAVVKASLGTRSTNAERQARYRERHRNERNVTERNGDAGDVTPPTPSPIKEKDQKKINPTPAPVCVSPTREGTDLEAEFHEVFWARYPHKVGKPDAQRKFVTARRTARLDEIMAGLDRYIASKPADRPWCNPATWLNQQRWADQPAAVTAMRPAPGQPPPRMKSVGHRLSDRLEAIARGEPFDPPSDTASGRTIDAVAHRH